MSPPEKEEKVEGGGKERIIVAKGKEPLQCMSSFPIVLKLGLYIRGKQS